MTLLPDEPLRLERLIRVGTIQSMTGEVYRCVGLGPSRRPGSSTREVGGRLRTVSRLADAIGAAGAELLAVTDHGVPARTRRPRVHDTPHGVPRRMKTIQRLEAGEQMPDTENYEILVIGSGEAGKYLAWTMAGDGHRTAVVERQLVGGSCPNIACLPSKNVIHSAKVRSFTSRGSRVRGRYRVGGHRHEGRPAPQDGDGRRPAPAPSRPVTGPAGPS